jgi:hypothetical protein
MRTSHPLIRVCYVKDHLELQAGVVYSCSRQDELLRWVCYAKFPAETQRWFILDYEFDLLLNRRYFAQCRDCQNFFALGQLQLYFFCLDCIDIREQEGIIGSITRLEYYHGKHNRFWF